MANLFLKGHPSLRLCHVYVLIICFYHCKTDENILEEITSRRSDEIQEEFDTVTSAHVEDSPNKFLGEFEEPESEMDNVRKHKILPKGNRIATARNTETNRKTSCAPKMNQVCPPSHQQPSVSPAAILRIRRPESTFSRKTCLPSKSQQSLLGTSFTPKAPIAKEDLDEFEDLDQYQASVTTDVDFQDRVSALQRQLLPSPTVLEPRPRARSSSQSPICEILPYQDFWERHKPLAAANTQVVFASQAPELEVNLEQLQDVGMTPELARIQVVSSGGEFFSLQPFYFEIKICCPKYLVFFIGILLFIFGLILVISMLFLSCKLRIEKN